MKEKTIFRVESEDPEFVKAKEGWVRTHRERQVIDYDELLKKKNLSKEEREELRLIAHILENEKKAN